MSACIALRQVSRSVGGNSFNLLSFRRQSTMFLQAPLIDSPNLLAIVKIASVAILGFTSFEKLKTISSAVAYGLSSVVYLHKEDNSSSRMSSKPYLAIRAMENSPSMHSWSTFSSSVCSKMTQRVATDKPEMVLKTSRQSLCL
ncbi:hypothetical protein IEQ34_015352 [Dendrobium chrysotoxum]|uniref:Uncharacterized protein n=1 Tax=Dendrobium chrysotoxum TaxID=161865 RepID=A0AAV7GGG3_DENCH|nr:hypothetical protein IEQ34_015352 [Dendrobium chrysotoxum]